MEDSEENNHPEKDKESTDDAPSEHDSGRAAGYVKGKVRHNMNISATTRSSTSMNLCVILCLIIGMCLVELTLHNGKEKLGHGKSLFIIIILYISHFFSAWVSRIIDRLLDYVPFMNNANKVNI